MKTKLILILLLFCQLSSAQVTKRDIGNTSQRDSGDYFLTYKDIMRHVGGQYDFWSPLGGYILNFKLENDLGKLYFKANGNRDLLVYDDDTHTFDFKYGITINGDPVGTSGFTLDTTRIPYLAKANTFTNANVFGTNVTINGTNVVDTMILSYMNSNIQFVPGQDTWIKTMNANPLYIGANNDTAIKISTNNGVRFYENIDADGQVNAEEINANTITNILGTTTLKDVGINGNLDLTSTSVISDLSIVKAAVANVGTGDNYGLSFTTNGIQRMHLDTSGNATLTGTLTANSFRGSLKALYLGTPRTTSATNDTLKISGSNEDCVVNINASNVAGNIFYFPAASNCPGKVVIVNVTAVATALQLNTIAGNFRGAGLNDVRIDFGSADQSLIFYSDGTYWWFNNSPF